MSFRQRMFELSKRLLMETEGQASVPGGCPPSTTLQSRQYISPAITFKTVQKLSDHADSDVPFFIPVPTYLIVVVSCLNANLSDSLFLSFTPLNLYGTASMPIGSLAIVPQGTENWIPLCNFAGTAKSKIGCGWVFKKPLPVGTMFLQMGQENGGGPPFPSTTFALCGDETVLNWHVGNQS
jgi:hypothetical protein